VNQRKKFHYVGAQARCDSGKIYPRTMEQNGISRVGTELLDSASPGKTILGSGLSTTLIHWQDMRVQEMIGLLESLPAEEIKNT